MLAIRLEQKFSNKKNFKEVLHVFGDADCKNRHTQSQLLMLVK